MDIKNDLMGTALDLLASAAYGAAADGVITMAEAHSIAESALKRNTNVKHSVALNKIKHWFNNYECQECGFNKEDRIDRLDVLMAHKADGSKDLANFNVGA